MTMRTLKHHIRAEAVALGRQSKRFISRASAQTEQGYSHDCLVKRTVNPSIRFLTVADVLSCAPGGMPGMDSRDVNIAKLH